MLYLGCHLSSSKGYAAMGRTALSIGANTFQFFTRNPRGGAAKSADPADAAVLVQMQQGGLLGPLVAHAPYTLNPCSKDERTREFAREVFADDLQRMELTPGNFYNFHPGSHVGQGIDRHGDLGTGGDMLQLRFAIVGYNPKVGVIHYLHQCLSGIDELPHVDVLASGYAIGRGHDDGV